MGKSSGGPIESWNIFIKGLIMARDAWRIHREGMMSVNLASLPIEAQRQLRFRSIHKASDFERALLQAINRWRTSGGLEKMLIILPKESEAKKDVKPTK